jgi:hypothetical protein
MISFGQELFDEGMFVQMSNGKSISHHSPNYINWTPRVTNKEISNRESWESNNSYHRDSFLSHPSISSTSSTENDIIKYTLRGKSLLSTSNSDPGVVPLTPPVPPAKDEHHLKNITRAALVGPSSAASPQGHLRTQSDPILYTNTNKVEVEERRSEGGLVRKKAQIYARVPLMLCPEPCGLPPPVQRTVPSLDKSSAVVSMEKIKSNGTCSRIIVKYDRVFVDKPISPLPIYSGSGEMSSEDVREERTEEIFPKMVCGLPCLSKEREGELNYTLEILSGVGVRRVEELGPRFKEKEV